MLQEGATKGHKDTSSRVQAGMGSQPIDDDRIETVIRFAIVERPIGIQRGYEICFTHNGIIFTLVVSALTVGAITGVPSGIYSGLGAGVPGGVGSGVGGFVSGYIEQRQRHRLENYTRNGGKAPFREGRDKRHDFYVGYQSISKVVFTDKGTHCRFVLFCNSRKVRCEFSYVVAEAVGQVLQSRLGDRMDEKSVRAIRRSIEKGSRVIGS